MPKANAVVGGSISGREMVTLPDGNFAVGEKFLMCAK